MPTKSPAQKRLMLAAAHTKGGYGGVSQAVGRKFMKADEAVGRVHSHSGVDRRKRDFGGRRPKLPGY